jgi:putative redox protein
MAIGDEPMDGVEVGETGAGRFQLKARTAGGEMILDEPVAAGGLGSGPSPYDLISAALGACTAMTLRLYAERKAWPLNSVVVRVVHRRDGLDARDRFAREVVLEGPLSPEQRARLKEIAEKCPVHRTLERGSEITTVLAELPFEGKLDPAPEQHYRDMKTAVAG